MQSNLDGETIGVGDEVDPSLAPASSKTTDPVTGIAMWSDPSNRVYIDFSDYLGFECTTTLTPWNEGVRWFSCSDGLGATTDSAVVQADPGFYLNLLMNSPEANAWCKAIPVDILNEVVVFDERFSEITFLLLRCISCSEKALELFLSDQFLMALILYAAGDQQWSVQRTLDITTLKRKEILKLCGIQGTKRVLNILGKLQYDAFSVRDYRCLAYFEWSAQFKLLNHLQYVDMRLLRFIRESPLYANARFLLHYCAAWDWKEVRMLLKDTAEMALRLDMNVDAQINQCSDTRMLRALHDRLVEQLNLTSIEDLPLIEFPAPPLKGNTDIIPITNNKQLRIEGFNQHHCVATYEASVLHGDYYVYSIMAPERATLGVRINDAGYVRIEQLKKAHNQKPSQETEDAIHEWMNHAVKHTCNESG